MILFQTPYHTIVQSDFHLHIIEKYGFLMFVHGFPLILGRMPSPLIPLGRLDEQWSCALLPIVPLVLGRAKNAQVLDSLNSTFDCLLIRAAGTVIAGITDQPDVN